MGPVVLSSGLQWPHPGRDERAQRTMSSSPALSQVTSFQRQDPLISFFWMKLPSRLSILSSEPGTPNCCVQKNIRNWGFCTQSAGRGTRPLHPNVSIRPKHKSHRHHFNGNLWLLPFNVLAETVLGYAEPSLRSLAQHPDGAPRKFPLRFTSLQLALQTFFCGLRPRNFASQNQKDLLLGKRRNEPHPGRGFRAAARPKGI